MTNLRSYGTPPFGAVVVHGGPGAAGQMSPVAEVLAVNRGVLEPLQTATSVAGQVLELKTVLEERADLPATVIGYSWGAWLCFMVAALHPALVAKCVLVGSGPFEEKYVAQLQEARLNRLSGEEKEEYASILGVLRSPECTIGEAALVRFGELASKADTYDAEVEIDSVIAVQAEIFQGIWREASALRKTGKLLKMGKRITCPVVAIHGEEDPHPAAGVREPLAAVLKNFRFILLSKCGHTPWIERWAKDQFYSILRDELS